MNIGRIEGGTNAGNRVVKPSGEAWVCQCGRANPRYMKNCPRCFGRPS